MWGSIYDHRKIPLHLFTIGFQNFLITELGMILDDPLVKKVLQDTSLGDEERCQEEVWFILS